MTGAARLSVRSIGAVLLGILLTPGDSLEATDRVYHLYDQQHGLPTDHVTDVAQDAAGFLWIATPAGLVRFDGDEMRVWESSSRAVSMVRTSARGEIIAVDDRGHLRRVDPFGGIVDLPGPDGVPVEDALDVLFGPSAALWVAREEEVVRRGPDGRWLRLPRERFGGEVLRGVRLDGDAGVFVLTSGGIWSVRDTGEIRREREIAFPTDVVRQHDGTVVVLASALFVEAPDGGLTPILQLPARPIDLLLREGIAWVSFDRFLVRFATGQPPAIIGAEDGLPGGGRLLVDREGSLWICSFRGLIHFPEPETITWTERDGLPSTHARFLGRAADDIWASTWAGLARITAGAGGRVLVTGAPHQGEVCVDGDGGVWYSGESLHEWRRGTATAYRAFAAPPVRFCTPARDGAVWLGVGHSIVRAAPGRVERMQGPPTAAPDAAFAAPLLEDREGRLWVAYADVLCRAEVARLARTDAWACESLPAGLVPSSLIEAGGTLWLGTHTGVFRRHPDGWRLIRASQDVGGGRVFKLRPGTAGSVWVLSLGRPTRVADRPASGEGWEVLEVLSGWHGHPTGGASDLLEEEDGTIWTAGAAGITRVPGRARRAPLVPPSVELAGMFVDGRAVPVDGVLELTHGKNLVELRFAALTYRDRSRVRYQARLGSGTHWTNLTAGDPVFRFAELPAGSYVAEFRASLDGHTWSPTARRLAFRVNSPWYLRWWVLVLAASGLAALLLAAHRARLRLALRLERQRTQIAMDLHDEIGSGLGSIGILTGIADSRTSDARSHAILYDIGETAAEMSTSLGDIVWSLRSRSRSLQELIERLAERGHRFFPDRDPAFTLRVPDVPQPVSLSLAVQRNVLLIAVEALHNAARHAAARRVELGLAPEGARWRIWIRDDGKGFEGLGSAHPDGLGLHSMRRRAAAIGAEFEVTSTRDRGTVVSVLFHPRAESRPISLT